MNDDLHRHLDGDLPKDALRPESRVAADEWDRMVAAFRTSAPRAEGSPAWLEQRVMAEIDALPDPGPLKSAWAWLTRPRPVPISPLATALAVACVAALLVWPFSDGPAGPDATAGGSGTPEPDPVVATSSGTGSPDETVIYVQFVLEAPGANSVAVAGDFTEWEPTFTLADPDGDGVWTGRVPVQPGVHGYMFLIDGTDWQTDPNASRYQDDGFGNRNAVVAVAASE